MPMKNPGSAPDRNIEWRKCPVSVAFSLVCSHSSRKGQKGVLRVWQAYQALVNWFVHKLLGSVVRENLGVVVRACTSAPRLGYRIGSSSSAWVTSMFLSQKRKEKESFDPWWQMIDWQLDQGRIWYSWSFNLLLFTFQMLGGGSCHVPRKSQGYSKNFCSRQFKEVHETFRLCLGVLLSGLGAFPGWCSGWCPSRVHAEHIPCGATLLVLRRGFSVQGSHMTSKGSSKNININVILRYIFSFLKGSYVASACLRICCLVRMTLNSQSSCLNLPGARVTCEHTHILFLSILTLILTNGDALQRP